MSASGLGEEWSDDTRASREYILERAQDRLQRAIDDFNSIKQSPLLTPEDFVRLDREDAAEDEAIILARLRFDGLAEPYSEEVHHQLRLLTSNGSKNTRLRNQE